MYLTYLNSLSIKNFRGINNLELNNLSNINILVGDNNCGKTSVLEAISLFQNPLEINNILTSCCKRGRDIISIFDLFLEMFPRENINKNIEIISSINSVLYNLNINGKLIERINPNLYRCIENDEYFDGNCFESRIFKGRIKVKKNTEVINEKEINLSEEKIQSTLGDLSNQIINMVYVSPYDYLYNRLIDDTINVIKSGEKEEVIKLLKILDNNIEDFNVLKSKNKPSSIYIKHSKYGFMSLSSFGDGVKKILTLASAVVSAKNGILLIDEIETAIYKNILNNVFGWLLNACKIYKVQLIATTHSLEVIDAFIQTSKNIDKLTCFRLEHYNENIYSNRLAGQKLKDVRCILGQDVR